MTDFRDRLRRGLKANDDANAAKREIAMVIAALGEAVEAETEGEVGLKVTSNYAGNPFSADRLNKLVSGLPIPESEMEHWIVAFSKKYDDIKPLKLARWEMDSSGYPCVIRFDRERLDAYDRPSLESAFGEMLEYSGTGGVIEQLNRKILAKQTTK